MLGAVAWDFTGLESDNCLCYYLKSFKHLFICFKTCAADKSDDAEYLPDDDDDDETSDAEEIPALRGTILLLAYFVNLKSLMLATLWNKYFTTTINNAVFTNGCNPTILAGSTGH